MKWVLRYVYDTNLLFPPREISHNLVECFFVPGLADSFGNLMKIHIAARAIPPINQPANHRARSRMHNVFGKKRHTVLRNSATDRPADRGHRCVECARLRRSARARRRIQRGAVRGRRRSFNADGARVPPVARSRSRYRVRASITWSSAAPRQN